MSSHRTLHSNNPDVKQFAVVVGATGLIGSSLVDQLVDSNHIHQVVTLTRRPCVHRSSKVINEVINFDAFFEKSVALPVMASADFLFSCLGTTLKQAGSIEAQRKVDLDYQYEIAELASKTGIKNYLLVSSSGANQHSGNAYLKMKGELEEKVKSLPFEHISIFQPSLLLGDRNDLRFGEKIGSLVLPLVCMVPFLRKYRPIQGELVARKMVEVSKLRNSGVNYFVLDDIFPKGTQ